MSDADRNMLNEIAEGEAWLAPFGTPAPSADLLLRVKRAVRSELAASPASARRLVRLRAWHGSVVAAAALALSVGVAWYSTRLPAPDPAVMSVTAKDRQLEKEIEALFAVSFGAEDTLADLESMTESEDWSLDETTFYGAFDEAFGEAADSDASGASLPASRNRNHTGEVS